MSAAFRAVALVAGGLVAVCLGAAGGWASAAPALPARAAATVTLLDLTGDGRVRGAAPRVVLGLDVVNLSGADIRVVSAAVTGRGLEGSEEVPLDVRLAPGQRHRERLSSVLDCAASDGGPAAGAVQGVVVVEPQRGRVTTGPAVPVTVSGLGLLARAGALCDAVAALLPPGVGVPVSVDSVQRDGEQLVLAMHEAEPSPEPGIEPRISRAMADGWLLPLGEPAVISRNRRVFLRISPPAPSCRDLASMSAVAARVNLSVDGRLGALQPRVAVVGPVLTDWLLTTYERQCPRLFEAPSR